MSAYRVTFERIGRSENGTDIRQTFIAKDEDELLEQIVEFVRPRLGSREWSVAINPETGEGHIEAGRFGRFTFEQVQP